MKMNSKFFKAILIPIFALFLFGCAGKNTIVLFNSQPITTKTVQNPQRNFDVGQKINYVILSKKGFRDKIIKVQLIQKDEDSEYWGYAPFFSKQIEPKNPNYYINYFVIHEKGHYIMQVFELKNLQTPIGYGEFWVKEK